MNTRFTTAALAFAAALQLGSSSPADADKVEITSVQNIVIGASGLDPFRRPLALAADPLRGVLLVADTGNRRVVVFDRTGRARGVIGSAPVDERGTVGAPSALALDRRGRIYVLDEIRRTIDVLTPTGSRIAELAPVLPSTAASGTMLQDLAIGSSGSIYLLYTGATPGILVLDAKGRTTREIGFLAASADGLNGPVAIAVSASETMIATVDPRAENSVRVISADGALVACFGSHGEGEGTFSLAANVAFGPGETVWVVDAVRHSLSAFEPDGRFIGRIGGFGAGPGQFNYPIACEFLADDLIAVLERAGDRLQMLRLDVETSGEPRLASEAPALTASELGEITGGRR
ncbi:MAG: NHL repeat-containing protein [bacterium]